MKCDRCGKEMSGNSRTVVCINVYLSTLGWNVLEDDRDFLQQQIGKYDLNREYRFCFECVLDNLFGVLQTTV